MENGPFEDVFHIENRDIPLLLLMEQILYQLIAVYSIFYRVLYIPGG